MDQDQAQLERRLHILKIGLLLAFSGLVIRIAYLQLVMGEYYQKAAVENHLRVIPLRAPRGRIFDSEGRLLATSKVTYSVCYLDTGGDRERALRNLATLIALSPEAINAKILANPRRSYDPTLIADTVTIEAVSRIEEQRDSLPGVYINVQPLRFYPNGSLLSHVIGYLGEVSSEDLSTWAKDYAPGDLVGKAGLERAYDAQLRGKDGQIVVEVDSEDQLVRVISREEPAAGSDLHLTIDLDVQRVAEESLLNSLITIRSHPWSLTKAENAYAGSLVALDPNTGAVIAMASYPNFDPNDWATGKLENETLRLKYLIGSKEYPNAMFNRAVLAAIAPGSTFKPVTLTAALETGVITESETISCDGYYRALDPHNPPKCWAWQSGGHGLVNAADSLKHSCNVYFYEVGRRMGIDRLSDYAKMFGLGEDTGFRDLPYEPESSSYFTHRSGPQYKAWAYTNNLVDTDHWYPGETIFSAIGQQFNAYSPLQLANLASVLANKGTRYRPAVVASVVGATDTKATLPQTLSKIELKDTTWKTLEKGMIAVTQPGGTSYSIAFGDNPALTPWTGLASTVAAKTGTAEVGSSPEDEANANGTFIAYAPVGSPRIAVSMVVEAGRGGSASCSTTVSTVIQKYLEKCYGGQRISHPWSPNQ